MAIIQILKIANSAMTTQQIADVLNKSKTYQKRDGSAITEYQIHGRTRKYPQLFDRNKRMISLKGEIKISDPKQFKEQIVEGKSSSIMLVDNNVEEIQKNLMSESNFKLAKSLDFIVPPNPGMYCIRIKNINALPKPFSSELKKRGHNIIYIGIATKSLYKRMLNQELRASGHGTFFRSIGAILGYKPTIGSLTSKKNKKNFKFSDTDEIKIKIWINENLLVNWIVQNSGLEEIETILILKCKPLLNIAKNPAAMMELSQLRKECVNVANGNIKP